MLKTVRMVKTNNVKLSAHPGLQDLFGFGWRRIEGILGSRGLTVEPHQATRVVFLHAAGSCDHGRGFTHQAATCCLHEPWNSGIHVATAQASLPLVHGSSSLSTSCIATK